MKKTYNEDGLRNLAGAIVLQAALDYREAAQGRDRAMEIVRDNTRSAGERTVYRGHGTRYERRLRELEAFFNGDLCHDLCGNTAAAILDGLRAETRPMPT